MEEAKNNVKEDILAPKSKSKRKKGPGLILAIVIIVILAAIVWQGGALVNKLKQDNSVESTEVMSFTIEKGLTEQETDLFLDSIKKRISNFELDLTNPKLEIKDNNVTITLSEQLPASFNKDDFINYILATPIFELLVQNDPANVKLSEAEIAQMEEYNSQAKTKAEDILAQVLANPDSFADLAKANSDDAGSKDVGGAYQGVTKGQFVPEYEEVLFNQLAVGEIYGELVKSQFGYHVIKKDAEVGEGDERKIDTSHILIKTISEAELLAPKQWLNSELSGIYLDRVDYIVNANNISLKIIFNEAGRNLFSEITKANLGKQIALLFDGTPLVTPTIDHEITGGEIVVNGDYPEDQVKLFVARINTGAVHSRLILTQ